MKIDINFYYENFIYMPLYVNMLFDITRIYVHDYGFLWFLLWLPLYALMMFLVTGNVFENIVGEMAPLFYRLQRLCLLCMDVESAYLTKQN